MRLLWHALFKTKKEDTRKTNSRAVQSPKEKDENSDLVGSFDYFCLNWSAQFFGTRTPTYEPIKPNAANSGEKTEFPGEWTSSIYDSVKVATENYDADNEKYSFTGGSSYEELEKLVGPPDTVTSWEKEDYGMPPRAMATWNKLKNGEYTSHSITIHYDKETMMITDKDHY